MRKRDRKELGRYVRWVADEMGLRDWHFDLDVEPPDDPEMYEGQQRAFADVCPTPGRRHAKMRFCEDFRFGLTADQQRMAVVHELVHCHLAALQHQCECDLDPLLGRPAITVFFNGFRRNLEYAVDGITAALTPHFPPIAWPD